MYPTYGLCQSFPLHSGHTPGQCDGSAREEACDAIAANRAGGGIRKVRMVAHLQPLLQHLAGHAHDGARERAQA